VFGGFLDKILKALIGDMGIRFPAVKKFVYYVYWLIVIEHKDTTRKHIDDMVKAGVFEGKDEKIILSEIEEFEPTIKAWAFDEGEENHE